MKDNKLIAEFMGLDSFKDSLSSLHQGKINLDVDVYEQAQYNTSWDWLMPGVEKCCILNNEEGFEPFYDLCELKIVTTHKAVVEFIKEYNLNN